MIRIYAVAFFVFLSPSTLVAQEMQPLSELIASGSEDTYPLVRCAGLFLSGLEWAGEIRLGPTESIKVKTVVGNIVEIATEMRKSSLGDGARVSVLRDVGNVSDAYVSRYKKNYATTGQAFGLDEMWQADTDLCVLLLGN